MRGKESCCQRSHEQQLQHHPRAKLVKTHVAREDDCHVGGEVDDATRDHQRRQQRMASARGEQPKPERVANQEASGDPDQRCHHRRRLADLEAPAASGGLAIQRIPASP